MKDKIPVLITTDNTKRGVFMGFIDPKDSNLETLTAEEVRMAVYWSTDVKGVIGLASNGPTKNCKISPAAPKAVLKGVTAVMEITKKALKAWRMDIRPSDMQNLGYYHIDKKHINFLNNFEKIKDQLSEINDEWYAR